MADKKYYRVTYMTPMSERQSTVVAANSGEAAIDLLRIPASRVVSARADVFATLIGQLSEMGSGLSLEMQAQVLSTFSAQLLSGMDSSRAFDRCLSAIPRLAKARAEIAKYSLTSDKMRHLKFDPQVVMMAQIGEKSGTLGEVIGTAADDLIERQKMMGEIYKKLIPAVILILAGVSAIVGLPMMLSDPLNKISNTSGITFNANILTYCIRGIAFAVEHYSYAVLAVLAGLVAMHRPIWRSVKNVVPFKFLNEMNRARRGLHFISSFRPLFESGANDLDGVRQIREATTGAMREAYSSMISSMESGQPISNGFSHELWPDLLRDGMRGFNDADRASKTVILKRLRDLLQRQMNNQAGKVSGLAGFAGMLFALFAVLMLFGGLTLPLMSVKAG